jgi:hypothetical protein
VRDQYGQLIVPWQSLDVSRQNTILKLENTAKSRLLFYCLQNVFEACSHAERTDLAGLYATFQKRQQLVWVLTAHGIIV